MIFSKINCFKNPAFCPFWMKFRDGFSCVIPHRFIYNKLNNTVSIIMSPFVAACIRHIFFIAHNTMYDSAICQNKIYLISDFSEGWSAGYHISVPYLFRNRSHHNAHLFSHATCTGYCLLR